MPGFVLAGHDAAKRFDANDHALDPVSVLVGLAVISDGFFAVMRTEAVGPRMINQRLVAGRWDGQLQ